MRRGFSAVEVLIATIIVGCAMLPILTIFSSGARQAAFDEYMVAAQTVAMCLVEQTIEELTVKGFKPLEKTHRSSTAGGFGLKDFDYEVRAQPQDGEAWLWLIRIKVSWHLPTDPAGAPAHTYDMDRLVSRPDASFTGRYPYRRVMDPNP